MQIKINGDAKDTISVTVKNVDSVVILAGAPVFMKPTSTTGPGKEVFAGPNGLATMFFGFATQDIGINKLGYACVFGYMEGIRCPAASTGTAGVTYLLPTAASAGVYSSAPGAFVAGLPKIILAADLIAAATENGRAKVFIRSL